MCNFHQHTAGILHSSLSLAPLAPSAFHALWAGPGARRPGHSWRAAPACHSWEPFKRALLPTWV